MSNSDAGKDKHVKQFWDEKAVIDTTTGEITQPDIHQRSLEISRILPYLSHGDRLLDLGCGDGYSTRIFADRVKEVVGMDYSKEMILKANKLSHGYPKITFYEKDMRNLSQSDAGLFDCVVTERSLINLASWAEQKKAISNISDVLVKGGTYIMCEGSADGRAELNKIRIRNGLSEMPPVWHNIDFQSDQTLQFISKYFEIIEHVSFGVYDLISRVVHPLLVAPEEPQYQAKINQIASDVSKTINALPECSRVLFLILKKI